VLLDVHDVALGHTTKMRWNDEDKWIFSEEIWRMQGSWNNGQSCYRCTFPDQYARTNQVRHPRAVYLREAEILPELDTWLTKALDPIHLPATIEDLAVGQHEAISPALVSLREEIDQCNRQLAQYRATLDSGGDPAVVGQWITETQAKKLAADARLRAATGTRAEPARMSKEQITATVNAIRELMQALRHATTEDKAAIYAGLSLHLTYNPGPRTVTARAEVGQTCTKGSCPRPELNHSPMLSLWPMTLGFIGRSNGQMAASNKHLDSTAGQAWIQAATTASVILLAVIAAAVSYGHMHALALRHGEGAWASALIPLSVDGMIVPASMSLLLDSRLGRRGGVLPWALLVTGALASLAANIAAAEPDLAGRVIAAWPSFALTASYELLMRQIRQSAAARTVPAAAAMPANAAEPEASGLVPDAMPSSAPAGAVPVVVPGLGDEVSVGGAGEGGRVLQRRAWQWALANRRPDGSLPAGAELAREFRRSARWGRLVKNAGLAGQLGAGM